MQASTSSWSSYLRTVTSGDSNAVIASRAGVSPAAVSRWLSGITSAPDPRTVISFARGYGQDPIYALFAAGYLTHTEINRAAPQEFALSDFTDLQLAQEIVSRLDSGMASEQLTEPIELDENANVVPFRKNFDPEQLPHAAYADSEEPGYPDED